MHRVRFISKPSPKKTNELITQTSSCSAAILLVTSLVRFEGDTTSLRDSFPALQAQLDCKSDIKDGFAFKVYLNQTYIDFYGYSQDSLALLNASCTGAVLEDGNYVLTSPTYDDCGTIRTVRVTSYRRTQRSGFESAHLSNCTLLWEIVTYCPVIHARIPKAVFLNLGRMDPAGVRGLVLTGVHERPKNILHKICVDFWLHYRYFVVFSVLTKGHNAYLHRPYQYLIIAVQLVNQAVTGLIFQSSAPQIPRLGDHRVTQKDLGVCAGKNVKNLWPREKGENPT